MTVKTVGILGGGQLARMMVLAGAPMGLRFELFDPAADACGGQVAPLQVAAFEDEAALAAFAERVDVVTFDFENVPARSAQFLADRVPVHPSPDALAVAQDRLSEKTLFAGLGIPLPPFADIRSRDELAARVGEFGLPCILKTRRFGYDGKGQFRLRSAADIDAAWAELGGQVERTGLILEGFVAFEREVSVVAVRALDGEFRAWPVTGNWHVNGVLSASVAPARLSPAQYDAAIGYARTLADKLDYVGVFALELFCRGEELLANEMAPRVHNSGHWTIEGSETSQFENHLRAVLGLPLGDTRMLGHACMLNWIGEMPDADAVLAQSSGHWHDYGKQPRDGRKVGHATLRGDDAAQLATEIEAVGTRLQRAEQVAPAVATLRG
ncbi:5-(carboxyamino)imidazole ribonucleotide synthase [Stenotrophomonas sp.]|uniref:5-(carboxyamino)imidazole ribonucleotide synthase n=1 Tax=Stenotrophomonas sp. TaxID=69392 RepID=UPI0028972653|nr:5-(carboxyamino)imidazole ribonucleotide synthase [Stenotrophomonas sp.]